MGQEGGQRRQRLAGLGIGRHSVGRRGVFQRQVRVQPLADRALAQLVHRQRHRVAAEAFLGHEALGGIDQFFEVLDPVGAFALGLVMLDQARMLQHQVDDLAQAQAEGLLAQHVDLGDEGVQVGAGLAGGGAHRVVQRAAGGTGHVLQLLDAAGADAARREVDHPQKAGVVVGVLQQPQVGQRVLDLGPLEKAQAAIHPVGHGRIEQRGLDHPALRIAAVEHRDLLATDARHRTVAAHQVPHFLDHPLRLGEVGRRLIDPHRLAGALRGAQVLAQPGLVVADQLVGRIEDVAEAAVVLLQLDLVLDMEFAHEIGHVADPRAAERVDALVVVADRQHRAAGAAHGAAGVLAGEQLEPGVLQLVGVLEFIDQDVAKAPLVVLAHRVVVSQQLVAAQHQLAEIDHALALALLLVQLVDLDLLPVFLAAHIDDLGPQAVLLAAGDEPQRLLGRKTLVIDIELLHQALDRRQLVLRVQDLKALRQIG